MTQTNGRWRVTLEPEAIVELLRQQIVTEKHITSTYAATPTSLEVRSAGHAQWTIALAIILFPIGLLLLLVKREYVMLVSAARDGDITHVVFAGNAAQGVVPVLAGLYRELAAQGALA